METALQAYPGKLNLLVAPRSLARRSMVELIARLGASGPVTILDGGNLFEAYGLARAIRHITPDLQAVLQRIHVARAFTCFQMAALLAQAPASPDPLVVLDLLGTFYDENTPLGERRRLLDQALLDLRRLAQVAAVVVSASPLEANGFSPSGERLPRNLPGELLERLEEICDQVWRFELPLPPSQPRLF